MYKIRTKAVAVHVADKQFANTLGATRRAWKRLKRAGNRNDGSTCRVMEFLREYMYGGAANTRESGRQSTAKCIVTIRRTMYILRLKYTVKRHMRIPLLQGIVSGLAHRMHGLRYCACVDAFISIVLCALLYMFARTSPSPAAL